jgi:ABC-2 type transport system permease protein
MSFLSKLGKKKKVLDNHKSKPVKKEIKPKEEKKEKSGFFMARPQINALVKLYFILAKNFKLILRSKRSAILFLVGPLLIVFLLGLAFNTSNLYDMNVAVYSESYSTISEDIVGNLSDSQYNVEKMNSEAECLDAVKFHNFHVCLVFPSNMILDNSANNIITIHVDNSRLNIANLISSQISSKVFVSAEELSEDMVSSILTVLDTVNTEVATSQATITNLQSLNSEAASSATSASSDLGGIDLTYSTVDTTLVDTEITQIISQNNISQSTFTNLEAEIDSLINSYNALTSKISTASSAITTTTSGLTALQSSLTSGDEKISKVSTSLTNMDTNIDTIKITNVDNIVTPIKTSIEPISSSNNYLLYIIPSILVMIFMFVALLLSSSNIITEKQSLAYFRNFITPTYDFLFILGQFLSNMTILFVEIIVVMATLYYFVPEPGVVSYIFATLVLLVASALFVSLGMLIGYMFNTKQTVVLGALSAGIVALFFSNTILPLETLSTVTRKVLMYNPFVLSAGLIKKILLFGATFAEINLYFYTLIGFAIALFVGAIVTRALFKRFFSA